MRPGPAELPFESLSPAGKSQRRDPTKHRAYNLAKGKTKAKKRYRAGLNGERKRRGLGKAGTTGGVLSHQRNGSLKIASRKANSAANGSGGRSKFLNKA